MPIDTLVRDSRPGHVIDADGNILSERLAAALDEIAAIPAHEVVTPRVDVPAAVLVVIGSAPKIELHRAAIAALLGEAGTRSIDRLVPLARALGAAHGDYLGSVDEGLEELATEIAEVRTRLALDASVLVRRKLLPPTVLAGLVGGQAYASRVADVTTLVEIFRMSWSTLAPRTKVTLADLAHAESRAATFRARLGERDRTRGRPREAIDRRARVFTLLLQSYDHVRRVLSLVRWHEGDVDRVAPSLCARPRRRESALGATSVQRSLVDATSQPFTQALLDLRGRIDALPERRLERVRLDIDAAVTVALGVASNAMTFQDVVRAELGESFAAPFDLLVPAARACARAHADHLVSTRAEDLAPWVAELSAQRALLLLEAQSLVHRKRMRAGRLAEIRGGTDRGTMVVDVLQLVRAFHNDWEEIEPHTTVTRLELDRAEALAAAIVGKLGENEAFRPRDHPSAKLRRRAYTLFVQTYDEVRRAISYVRWNEGDVDEIVPSLFGRRSRRRVGTVARP